jgi:hypothetical protein
MVVPSLDIKKLVNRFYFPAEKDTGWTFAKDIGHNRIRYFSFGRYALFEALQMIGMAKGEKILLPAFICRELLSAVNTIGAVPLYYDVDSNLQIEGSPDLLPQAKAILAVNYFGFPQNMDPFRKYCEKSGATLIEDNAHGFLSRDDNGSVLGTRGDIGIFSIRKTVAVPDGAAMVVNTPDRGYTLRPQRTPSQRSASPVFIVKRILRKCRPVFGLRIVRLLTSFNRVLRKVRTGHEILPSAPDAELRLPGNAAPCKDLFPALALLDIGWEISRRRELYALLDSIMKKAGYQPLYRTLPAGVVPYAYPFFSQLGQIETARRTLRKINLECFSWPELPDAISPKAPEHYKSVWMVGFLW